MEIDDSDRKQDLNASRSASSSWISWSWWAVMLTAFMAFVLFGRVRTYLGAEGRGESSVWNVWRRLADDLPNFSLPGLLRAGYVVDLLVFVIGSFSAIWLALQVGGSDDLRNT